MNLVKRAVGAVAVVAAVFGMTACSADDARNDEDVNVRVPDSTVKPTCTTTSTAGCWGSTIKVSKCTPIKPVNGLPTNNFGYKWLHNSRVAKAVWNSQKGYYETPCMDNNTKLTKSATTGATQVATTMCKVHGNSAPYFQGVNAAGEKAYYLKTGFNIDSASGNTKDANGGAGKWAISTKVDSGTVPCLDLGGSDSAGISATGELAASCVVETANSQANATGLYLKNYATRQVCTSTYPHPDGALLVSKSPYCYTYEGAGINDPNGTERDDWSYYLPDTEFCHVIWANGLETIASKRPATTSYPAPGAVDTSSSFQWRTVNTHLDIAN